MLVKIRRLFGMELKLVERTTWASLEDRCRFESFLLLAAANNFIWPPVPIHFNTINNWCLGPTWEELDQNSINKICLNLSPFYLWWPQMTLELCNKTIGFSHQRWYITYSITANYWISQNSLLETSFTSLHIWLLATTNDLSPPPFIANMRLKEASLWNAMFICLFFSKVCRLVTSNVPLLAQ